jgi:hypothetical protein
MRRTMQVFERERSYLSHVRSQAPFTNDEGGGHPPAPFGTSATWCRDYTQKVELIFTFLLSVRV